MKTKKTSWREYWVCYGCGTSRKKDVAELLEELKAVTWKEMVTGGGLQYFIGAGVGAVVTAAVMELAGRGV